MTIAQGYSEELVEVGGLRSQVFKGGSGSPVLLLHDAITNPGWTDLHRALAQRYTVYAPSHAGYDKSDRGFVSNITDLAHYYLGLMRSQRLDRVSLIGISMGGWVAAEIAAMNPQGLKSLVLVDAAGIKPEVGEIAEVLMVSPDGAQKAQFHDQAKAPNLQELDAQMTQERRDTLWRNREMTSRLCWTPYFHNPSLPAYLRNVQVPTLIVWGREDNFIPLNSGELLLRSIPGAALHVIDNCGHFPHLEQPQELQEVVLDFLSKH
jgi:pimeloyl-ACP methyl ester carboxylesterase